MRVRVVSDKELVRAHARFVAAEEHLGYTRIVIRSADGSGRLESTIPLPTALAWAAVAVSLEADDAIARARAEAVPPPKTVLDLDLDDLLDLDGEPFPFTDEQPWRAS